jgi:hypothetical protein
MRMPPPGGRYRQMPIDHRSGTVRAVRSVSSLPGRRLRRM